jgi:hypothetical protein
MNVTRQDELPGASWCFLSLFSLFFTTPRHYVSSLDDFNKDLLFEPSSLNILKPSTDWQWLYCYCMKIPPSYISFKLSEWYVVRMVIRPIVLTGLNLLTLAHWNLHHGQILNICFATVPKRRRLFSTLLAQGTTLHYLTLRSFSKACRSSYFQCCVCKYAHVSGLKLHKIRQIQA